LIQNGFLDDNKILERYGYSLAGNDTGEDKPNLLLFPHETSSNVQLLKINDNAAGTVAELHYWTGSGSWVKVASPTFTAGLRCTAVTAQGKTYITNGTDVVKSWDGSTLANVASIPIVKYLVWFHNYLWGFHNNTYRNRMYFSNIGDPETFGASDFQDINPEDNDFITGASSLKNEIIIGKRYRMYGFQGWLEPSIQIQAVNERLSSYGTIAHQSFVNTGNDLLFASYGGNYPNINSLIRTRYADTNFGAIVTDPIQGTMDGLSKSQLDKAASIFDERYAWFAFPNGSSTYNDLVLTYDTVTKGWSKHTGIYAANFARSTVSGRAQVYFGDSRNAKVYVLDESDTDNGEIIDFKFQSRKFTPDFKRLHKYKYLWIRHKCGSAGTLNVYSAVDEYDWVLEDAIDLTCDATVFPYTFPLVLGATTQRDRRYELAYSPASSAAVQFTKADTNDRVEINNYAFSAYKKALRDLP
jgi:hypothetical protein